MSARTLSAAALALPLLLPLPAAAQLSLPGITISDVARGIRIVRAARDVATMARAAGIVIGRRGGTGADGGATRSPDGGRADGSIGSIGSMSSAARGRAAITTGARYVGTPYVWGGSTPAGFDCSGFVQYVYRKQGVPLPRTSRQMAHAGQAVPARISALRAGDLMLFRGRDGVINHVALYAGNDRILQSSSSGGGVRFDDLWGNRGDYYRTHLVAARRVSGSGPALIEALTRLVQQYPFDHFDLPDEAPAPGR